MSWSRTPDNYVIGVAGFKSFELSQEEAMAIIPAVETAYNYAKRKYEYFLDIHESGEASCLQQTKMVQWDSRQQMFHCLLHRLKNK